MDNIKLSYVMTTYNKLPYLKEVMKRLLENVQEDEEIVVIDGASTDGTVEYLTELYKQGKIHQFLSEPDKGEAHGFNKGMLMARGELIKLISDDDAFYYPGIQQCKNFMLKNEDFDFLFANAGHSSIKLLSNDLVHDTIYNQNYHLWLAEKKAFIFNGLSIMIRKKSLPLIGLLASDFILVDCEIALRACKLASMVLYTGYISVNINNPCSKPRPKDKNIAQLKKLEYFYDWELPPEYQQMLYPDKNKKNISFCRAFLAKIKRVFKNIVYMNNIGIQSTISLDNNDSRFLSFSECLCVAEKWLEEKNNSLLEKHNIFLTPH